MGRDGAQGLLQLRGLGWRTIAQDESSSVVWGMPKAAVEIGAAEEILPLARIAEAIARLGPRSRPFPDVSAMQSPRIVIIQWNSNSRPHDSTCREPCA